MSLVANLPRALRLPRLPRITVPGWVFLVLGALLIAALIWLVGPLVSIAGHAPLAGWIARLVTIALVAAAFGGWFLYKRLRAGRANRALVSELAAPPSTAPPADDLSAQDVKAMEERSAKALELMRGTRVGPQRELVYELPWYVIIGPPGPARPQPYTIAACTSLWRRRSAPRRSAASAARAPPTGGSPTAPS